MNISGICKKNPMRSVDTQSEGYNGYEGEETVAQLPENKDSVSPEIPD